MVGLTHDLFPEIGVLFNPEAVSEMPSSRSTTGSWENDWIHLDSTWELPSGSVKIAIENGHL